MKKRFVWVVVSGLVVLALLLAACAPAPEKEAAPVTPTAPAVKETTPAVKETAPAVKEAAPTVPENMVKISLKKLDGTVVEKLLQKPKYGGTMILSRSAVILGWDEAFVAPWTLSSSLGHTNENLMEGLWARGPTGTGEFSWGWSENFGPQSWGGLLAESWDMRDETTVVFHIRKGVRWGLNPNSAASRLVNGREFTADDVVFNLKRIYMDIPTSTMYGMLGEASRPTDVYATDKYTVVMKVPPGSMGPTLHDVGHLTKMVPPEVVKKYGDMNKWENVVGTGAFFLADYVAMSSAAFVKNPNYWLKDYLFPENQLPYLDGLKMLIIPDKSTRLAALRTGKVDLDTGTYAVEDALPLLKSNPNLKSRRMPPSGCTIPNLGRMDKPELPAYDIRVRKALIMAVDNQEIVDTYYGGDASPLTYKIPPIPEYIANGQYTPLEQLPPEIKEIYTYNPAKAKQLLTEAGYPNGFKIEVVISSGSPESIDVALIVKEYWKKNLNVDLTLDIKDTTVATSIYLKKTHKEMLWWGRAGNQQLMYTVRKGNMYNWAMIDDPKIEQYYQEISAAYLGEPQLYDKLMKEMNLYVLSQAWYYPMPRPFSYRIWQPWLMNYNGESSLGVYSHTHVTKLISVDQELKKSLGY